jgi:hypothetical protein
MNATRVVSLTVLGLAMVTAPLAAQQWDDSFKWYIGAQGGVLGFETPTQTRSWVPTGGGHIFVMARRTGLIVSVDQGFGDNESTGYSDVNVTSGVRPVTFANLRRYSATLTGYPVRGSAEPYFGVGFGLLQVVNPQPQGVFSSPQQFTLAQRLATQKSTDGFISFLAGVQARVSRWQVFGQYQITSSPSDGNLLRGPSHGFSAGLRLSLGGAKEGVRGGGY